jgi:hypothetical protein
MTAPDPLKDESVVAVGEDATAERYLRERLLPQVAWLDDKARRAKQLHIGIGGGGVGFAGAVPFVNSIATQVHELVYLSSAMSAVVAVATALSAFGRYQDTWSRYREASNELTSLRFRFEHRVAPFDGEDRLARLVDATESILSGESTAWASELRNKGVTGQRRGHGEEKSRGREEGRPKE